MYVVTLALAISLHLGPLAEGAVQRHALSGAFSKTRAFQFAADNVTAAEGSHRPRQADRRGGRPAQRPASSTKLAVNLTMQTPALRRNSSATSFFRRESLKRIDLVDDGEQVFIALARLGSSYELLPRDFLVYIMDWSEPHSQAIVIYGTVLLVSGILLGTIYGNRGVSVCLAIQCYVFSLSIMTLLIRMVFVTYRFPYALWVTATHFLMTATVAFGKLCLQRHALGTKLRIPDVFTLCLGVLPVGFVFAASIAFSNQALVYSNAHFFEMFNSLGLLVTAGLGVLLGRPIGLPLVPPLLALTAGLIVVSFGEVSCSWMGVLLIFLGMGFRAAKAQLQALLLSGGNRFMKFEPTELVLWSSIACLFVLVPWSLISEGHEPFIRCTETGVLPAIFLGMVNACFLNIAGLYVLKELGPVAQQAVGNFKSILACLSAVVAFSEVITTQQVLGYAIIVAACVWYNRVDMRTKAMQDDIRFMPKTLRVKAEAAFTTPRTPRTRS